MPFDVLGEPICVSVPVHGFLKQNPQSGLASRAGAGEQPSHHLGRQKPRLCFQFTATGSRKTLAW